MRRLMLLRHAKSDWPAGMDDHERPLAKRGRRASPLMGKYMAREGLVPDLAIVSTATRTQQTWALACAAFALPIARRDERRIYEAPAPSILDIVYETADDVQTLLLVGHNPGLQDLALDLVATTSGADMMRLREKYPTGGLAVIDFNMGSWRDAAPETGALKMFAAPKSIDPAS